MSYDPEIYLESAIREIEEYANTGFNNSVLDENLLPFGLQAFEVVMEFPGQAIDESRALPLEKTLVHFALDDQVNRIVGFGENIFATNYDSLTSTIKPQEASVHMLNFDVGIWASAVSGGTTSRMRAQQILKNLFVGSLATQSLMEASDGGDGGVEILRYSGGMFIVEKVNDLDVFRMIGAELEVRVYSRTPLGPLLPAIDGVVIEEIVQAPDLG